MKVKVWNDNNVDHVEKYREEMIRIPAGKFVEMEESDAKEFRTQFFPLVKSEVTVDRIHPQSRKMIRVEYPEGSRPVAEDSGFRSPLTGEVFTSQKELDKHLAANADKVHQDPEVEKQLKSELAAKAAALGLKLEEIAPVAESSKKPGPKKKTA